MQKFRSLDSSDRFALLMLTFVLGVWGVLFVLGAVEFGFPELLFFVLLFGCWVTAVLDLVRR